MSPESPAPREPGIQMTGALQGTCIQGYRKGYKNRKWQIQTTKIGCVMRKTAIDKGADQLRGGYAAGSNRASHFVWDLVERQFSLVTSLID